MNVLGAIDEAGELGTPEIYDLSIDQMRAATQADIDRLLLGSEAQGLFRKGVRLLEHVCSDTCRGDVSIQQMRSIVGALAHAYTSPQAQRDEQDLAAGRMLREERDRKARSSIKVVE